MSLQYNDSKKHRKQFDPAKLRIDQANPNSLDKTKRRDFPSTGPGFQFVPDGASPDLKKRGIKRKRY